MKLHFTKMHGLGNDFIVFNAIAQPLQLSTEQIRFLADRKFGVGCDQLLLVEAPRKPQNDFHYRIFNADGSEVEQCGNGARCFARFVLEKGLTEKTKIAVGTSSGDITLYAEGDLVRVNMGVPELEPARIPFQAETRAARYPIEVDGQALEIGAVSMGNPHAVLQVENTDTAPVETLGPLMENHPRFPQRVNAGFMQILAPNHIRLRVYERGTGETLACGTGACGAVVAGRVQGLLDSEVVVTLRGGDLVIKWDGERQPVWMSGPAETVFEGSIEL